MVKVQHCTFWLQVKLKYHQTLHLSGIEEETGGLSHREKYSKVGPSQILITANIPTQVQFIKAQIEGGHCNGTTLWENPKSMAAKKRDTGRWKSAFWGRDALRAFCWIE